MAATAAQKARAVRQEALRDYLSNRGLLDHVIDLIEKIQGLQPDEEAEFHLKKYKAAADLNLRLINKYLGDEKSIDTHLSVDEDSPLGQILKELKPSDSMNPGLPKPVDEQRPGIH